MLMLRKPKVTNCRNMHSRSFSKLLQYPYIQGIYKWMYKRTTLCSGSRNEETSFYITTHWGVICRPRNSNHRLDHLTCCMSCPTIMKLPVLQYPCGSCLYYEVNFEERNIAFAVTCVGSSLSVSFPVLSPFFPPQSTRTMMTMSTHIFIVPMVMKPLLQLTHPTCEWAKTPSGIKCKYSTKRCKDDFS
jgi:hypothetical protein